MNGFLVKVNMNILPLWLYDILISMDWLEQHLVMLDILYKWISCTDIQVNPINILVIPKKVFVRQISSLQAKKCIRKGCKLFPVKIQDIEAEREQHIEEFQVLVDFKDVFPEEISWLPSKGVLNFSIELTPRSVSASKSPYCMIAP